MIDADVHKATSFWHPDTSPRPHFVFHIVTIDLSMSTYRYSDPNKRCQDVFPECELDIYLIFTSYFQVFPPFLLSVLWLLHCYTAPNKPLRCRCSILPSLGRRGGFFHDGLVVFFSKNGWLVVTGTMKLYDSQLTNSYFSEG